MAVPKANNTIRGATKRAASKVASVAAYDVATVAAGVYTWLIVPLFQRAARVVRNVTNLQATMAGCLAMMALMVALAALTSLVFLGMFRHYMYVEVSIVRALQFDYTGPTAVAEVSLVTAPASPWPLLGPLMGLLTLGSQSSDLSLTLPVSNSLRPGEESGNSNNGSQGVGQSRSTPLFREDHPGQAKAQRGKGRLWGSKISGEALLPDRPLVPGQVVALTVHLQLPSSHTDLFQVTGELLGGDHAVLAKGVHTHLHRNSPWTWRVAKHLATLPLQLFGCIADTQDVHLTLIPSYAEHADHAALSVRITLASRTTSRGTLPPPPVYGGHVEVRRRLGVVRTLVRWLSPSLPVTLALGGVAGAITLISGSLAAGLSVLAFLLNRLGRVATQASPIKGKAAADLDEHELAEQLARVLLRKGQVLLGPDGRLQHVTPALSSSGTGQGGRRGGGGLLQLKGRSSSSASIAAQSGMGRPVLRQRSSSSNAITELPEASHGVASSSMAGLDTGAQFWHGGAEGSKTDSVDELEITHGWQAGEGLQEVGERWSGSLGAELESTGEGTHADPLEDKEDEAGGGGGWFETKTDSQPKVTMGNIRPDLGKSAAHASAPAGPAAESGAQSNGKGASKPSTGLFAALQAKLAQPVLSPSQASQHNGTTKQAS